MLPEIPIVRKQINLHRLNIRYKHSNVSLFFHRFKDILLFIHFKLSLIDSARYTKIDISNISKQHASQNLKHVKYILLVEKKSFID